MGQTKPSHRPVAGCTEAQLAAVSPPRPGLRQPASYRPPPPGVVVARPAWKVTSIRTAHGPKPLSVHVGDCTMDDYGRGISRDEARRLITEGVEPCPYCSPENALGMTG
ncbi:hypothetical protein Slala03_81420 [Streptomyces lavendulae subsp. lavendulae]|uniref:DUF6233 domain-containing protein n=1 Tax=Streptomyces lavendulae TaxID=1914 RepID=UPI0024A07F70|nr:hypothetical protein Slala03_81420 [Streptomyces lavendulae subsp. lavendulae]